MKPILAILSAILLVSCSGRHHSSSSSPEARFMHSSSYPGCGYVESCNAVMFARELTDQEIEDAPNGHGCGIHEALEVAQNPDKYAVDFFQLSDGTIIIMDENDIHVIS